KDSRSIDVAVPAGAATTPAHLERLQGPSPSSVSGATLAGQRIGPNGRFHDRKIIELVSARDGAYRVHLPAYSAAMLEIPRT
ncbi:MAG: glycosyl hydrolase family 79 C-terminal domain-containing protein, partial [Solirubrobacteraceae bacterium]